MSPDRCTTHHICDCRQAMLAEAQRDVERLTKEKIPMGAACGQCGLKYWEYKGHIIPCPRCEVERLKPFVLAILEYFGSEEMPELEYCDFQEMATKFKVIRWEKYSPEKHGTEDYDADEGDDIWFPAFHAAQKETL